MLIKKVISVLLKVLIALPLFLCLLCCFLPWVSHPALWWVSMLGLAYPFLLFYLMIFMIVVALKRSKLFWVGLVLLLISSQQLFSLFGFSLAGGQSTTSPSIKVISWNVSRWDERNKEKRGGESYRKKMLAFLEKENADVLCLQEFFECHDAKYFESNIPALKKMGYPYYHFYPSFELFNGSFQYGLAIFSKHPIVGSKSFPNAAKIHSEGLVYADIKFNEKIFRVFNSHLESPGLGKNDLGKDGQAKLNRTVFQKVKNAYQFRNIQAEMARKEIKASTALTIHATDLGDVPNSYAYFTVKGEMNDLFLEKGLGLGATYRFIAPTMRIDYLFASKQLTINDFQVFDLPYSDHRPLVGVFSIN